MSISWSGLIPSPLSYLISLRFNLTLSSFLCLGLPGGPVTSTILAKSQYAFPSEPTLHVTCPTYLIFLDLTTIIIFCKKYVQIGKLLLTWKTNFLAHTKQQAKVHFCILGLCLCKLDMGRRKILDRMVVSIPRIWSALNFPCLKFKFVIVVPKYFKFSTFSNDFLFVFMLWSCSAFYWRDMNVFSQHLHLDQPPYWRIIKLLCSAFYYLCFHQIN
jgi:hypothetical protein